MIIRYNTQKLEEMIADFYNVTHIPIAVLDTAFNHITRPVDHPPAFCQRIFACEGGHEKCDRSDQIILTQCAKKNEPVMHLCHAGLLDIATPIVSQQENIVMGYLIMGRSRNSNDFGQIADRVANLPGAYEEWEADYMALPYQTTDTMQSAAKLAVSVSASILQNRLIWVELDDLAKAAAAFISENISEALPLQLLCDELNVSKTLLYTCFHSCFDSTVNDYITKERIKKAKSLLSGTSLSVSQICEQVGLKTPTYFCQVFRKQTGMTPLAYRKKKKNS